MSKKWRKPIFQLLPRNPDFAWFSLTAVLKYIYVICLPGCLYWKNCVRGLEYGSRPKAEDRTQDRGHSCSQDTDRPRPANNVFILFFLFRSVMLEIPLEILKSCFAKSDFYAREYIPLSQSRYKTTEEIIQITRNSND